MTANVFIAILAKQKAKVLPLFLRTIDELDYPKENIVIYVRTNNNTDNTKKILEEWIHNNADKYKDIIYNGNDIEQNVQAYDVHEWNGERFRALAKIRQESLNQCLLTDCEYYFVVDVDNFIFPDTLKCLIEADKPIVAPLLRYAVATEEFPDTPEDHERIKGHEGRFYSNFHYMVDDYGSIISEPVYYQLLYQTEGFKGLFDVDCVHCTYLIKREYIHKLSYLEDSDRWEYMVFSSSARKARVDQYLDTRQIYGILTLTENNAVCEWMYEYLRDPQTRYGKYLHLNPQMVFQDPKKIVVLSD